MNTRFPYWRWGVVTGFLVVSLVLYILVSSYMRPKILDIEIANKNVHKIFERLGWTPEDEITVIYAALGPGRDKEDYYHIQMPYASIRSLRDHLKTMGGRDDSTGLRQWRVVKDTRIRPLPNQPDEWRGDFENLKGFRIESVYKKDGGPQLSDFGYNFVFVPEQNDIYIVAWSI